jgi:hypothetical protein
MMVQWGINLNPEHPVGQPSDPNVLQGVKWVRVVFKVGAAQRTLDQAFAHYDSLIAKYNGIGAKVLFVLNQETFWGNAPWHNGDWTTYARDFAQECGRIAGRFAGRGVAWEVWNEGDLRGESSVFVNPGDYAKILREVSPAIKAKDASAPVIVGGLAGGDEAGYLNQVRQALGAPLPVDAIGYHPYAHYPPNFAHKPDWGGWFGELAPKLAALTSRFPGTPVWITEIGVSEHIPFPPEQYPMVTKYMEGIHALVSARFSNSIPVVVWFAWSDGMRNAGIVDGANQPKPPVYDKFFAIVKAANEAAAAPPPVDPKLTKPMKVVSHIPVRIRTEPRRITSTLVLDRMLQPGDTIMVDPNDRRVADDYIWWRHAFGWSASERADGTEIFLRPADEQGNLIEETAPAEAPAAAPITPPAPAQAPAAAPAKLRFRVVLRALNIRTEPRTGTDTLTNKRLVLGDEVEVEAASRTEAGGYVWWRHSQGWSVSRTIDGAQVWMEQIDTKIDKNSRILEVPWVSQVDLNSPGAFDCGQACVLMLLKYYGKGAGLIVKNLTDLVGGRTTGSQLVRLAADFELTIEPINISNTVAALQTGLSKQIDAGRPVILLVNYRDLRFDNIVASKSDPGLHWLVVVGNEGDRFYVNDPLWMAIDRNGRGGNQVPIRIDALTRSYRSAALG